MLSLIRVFLARKGSGSAFKAKTQNPSSVASVTSVPLCDALPESRVSRPEPMLSPNFRMQKATFTCTF